MDSGVLERLIGDLLGVEGMLLVIDSGGAVSEMHARDMRPTEFGGGWATIESQDWHVHLDTRRVAGVQFVVNSDHGHDAMPKLFYARLSGADGGTLLRFYFPNPWLDDDEKPTAFQPERLDAFKDFCRRYAGADGVALAARSSEGDAYYDDADAYCGALG